MSFRNYFKLITVLCLTLAVIGCGGTTSPDESSNDSGSSSGGGGTDTTDPTTPSTDTVRLGTFNGDGDFVEGTIDASRQELTAGQSATLKIALVNSDDSVVTTATDVAFTSNCVSDSLSDIDPANTTTTAGRANTTYTANGCDGADVVSATAVVDGTALQAQVTLQTQTAPPGAITFNSSDTNVIGIKGTGGTLPEQANVSFKVTNTSGGPAPNQPVTFDLNTRVGGIGLSNDQGMTDANGLVSTTVTAGTVATTVRVTAETMTNSGSTLTTQSNGLSITTGVPDNDSFTIGAEQLNIEGWDVNNKTTQVTALLADRFNNPVPDGTSVTFRTEGGSIDGSCETENGQCSVTFRSQNPRPADGRVTILATATGEESFSDANANGSYDASESFMDLAEAYRDDNENGSRDSNEPFVDYNNDQNYTPGSGNFTGVLCNNGCDQSNTLNVRDQLVLVLSGSNLNIGIEPASIDLSGGPVTVTVTILDSRGQVVPADTQIEAEATQGSIVGTDSYTQGSTSDDPSDNASIGRYVFRLEPGDEPGQGVLLITATTPNGTISRSNAVIQQN